MKAIPRINAIQWCKPLKAVAAHFTSNRIFIIQCHIMHCRLLWNTHTFQITGALLSNATFCIIDVHTLQITGTPLSSATFCIIHVHTLQITGTPLSSATFCIIHVHTLQITGTLISSTKFCIIAVHTLQITGTLLSSATFCITDRDYQWTKRIQRIVENKLPWRDKQQTLSSTSLLHPTLWCRPTGHWDSVGRYPERQE